MEVAHPQKGSSSTWFLVELEFGNVGFWGEGKTEVPGEKSLSERERTINKLNQHIASTPGFEPGPHWWEARALTTAPPLLPKIQQLGKALPQHNVFDCQCNKTIIKKMLSDMSSYYICTFTCPSVLGVAIVTDCTNLTTMPWKSTQQKRELEIK